MELIMKKHLSPWYLLLMLALAANHALASSILIEQHQATAPAINPTPVLELYVTLTDKVTIGEADDGDRYFVPITGGHFFGKNIKGKVNGGGADWQVVRRDDIKEINALYSIETDDGVTIVIDNKGMINSKSGERYAITAPKFHAPKGKYDWLNEGIFIGNITSIASPRAVVIRVYAVL